VASAMYHVEDASEHRIPQGRTKGRNEELRGSDEESRCHAGSSSMVPTHKINLTMMSSIHFQVDSWWPLSHSPDGRVGRCIYLLFFPC
jgi:hypothetical protein